MPMYELEIAVTKVLGTCTAQPPMKPGDRFHVRDGSISIAEGGWVCMFALQSLMPLIPAKERALGENTDDDWMLRVHHVQCPDPDGRVIFRISRTQRLNTTDRDAVADQGDGESRVPPPDAGIATQPHVLEDGSARLHDLQIVVDEVRGRCTSGMRAGDSVTIRSGRLYIPAHRAFCLYALQAVLPLLPAKQRCQLDGDWLSEASRVICPDPAGNVILRIERI